MTPIKGGLASATLAEVCILVTDGTHDTPKRVEKGYPLVKAKEIVGGRIDFESSDRISAIDHLKVISRSKPELGDTLFAHIGASLGEAAYVSTSSEFSIKNIALFKPNPEVIDGRYLYYLVISPYFQALAKGSRTGSAQPFLSLGHLRSHPILFHTELLVQHRIASILSAYDDLIENNARRIAIMEEMARRIYEEWFVRFCFPGHQNVGMVESELGAIPKGWRIACVGDYFDTVLGGTPSRSKPEFWQDGTIPWISSGKVNELRILEASEKITDLGLAKSSTKLMPAGTTVIAITGATLGQVSMLSSEFCANQSVVGIYDPSGTWKEFIFWSFKTHIESIIQHASGGAQQHINKDIVNAVKFVLPDDSTLQAFNALVKPMNELVLTLLRKNINLRITRDLLLAKLVSGELDVSKVLEPESA